MKIGAGSFGIVFSADYQGKSVAVKCPILNFVDGLDQFIDTIERGSENLRDEYKFLEQINKLCPNITVKVNRLMRFGPINYIIEEFFGEPLQCVMLRDHQTVMENFDKIAQGIMTCVEQLNNHGYLHCDVKLNNFLVNDAYDIRLIDFGQSVQTCQASVELKQCLKTKTMPQKTPIY